jgi:tyrosyl-tRNA synthetase
MDFIDEFIARGFFHQATDLAELKNITSKEKIVAYIGFDPTASSLHVGNLMQIMILRLLQKHGHKPIILVGGGTARVGDPSGKDQMRKVLSLDDIEKNIDGIKSSISKYIKFSANDALILNNNDWLKNLNYIDYLRDYGKYFSVNRMLKFDSVKLRLEREQNLSFLEFNYMLLQAYDFVELNRQYGCRLQIGGSDQWGNIVNGIELNRRLEGEEIFGLTSPLITNSSGNKMGKTANGAIWLNQDLCSAYDYYQFWRNTDDLDVIKFMKLFTDIDLDQIEEYTKYKGSEINLVKKILAFEATKLCHGLEAAEQASLTASKLFEQNSLSEDLPTIEIKIDELSQGVAAYSIFYRSALADSASHARRLIRGRGAKINDQLVEDENLLVTNAYCNESNVIKLTIGKKKHALVRCVDLL